MSERKFVLIVPRNKRRGILVPFDLYEHFFDLINLNNFPVSVSAVKPSSGVFESFRAGGKRWRVTKAISAFVVEMENEEVKEGNGY